MNDFTKEELAELRREYRQSQRRKYFQALKALFTETAREEDYTTWRAAKVLLAMLLGRRGLAKKDRDDWRKQCSGVDICFFNHRNNGYSWSCDYLELLPGLRYDIYSDGECLL